MVRGSSPDKHKTPSGQLCVVSWVRPVFRTDQSDDCGSNPHLGVTVPKFLLLFFDRKALPILNVQQLCMNFFSSSAGQYATSSLVHDD